MDIVEEFVVTLGLDPSNYKRESRQFRDDFRRLKEDTRRDGREIEAENRRVAESFGRIKNEIIGLALAIAGARSIGGLVQDMIHGAAETGRFAQTVDMATESVSTWEMAVQSMGGTAQDARSALAALNAEYTSYMLTGRAVHDADLNAMGIGARDLQSPEQLALALAERRNSMTQREFTARLERMGLPPSFIRTLAQGRRGVEELLDQMQRVGPVTEADARAAIEMERQWAILTARLRNELRPVLTWLVDHALPWIEEHGPEVARVLGIGIGGAVGLMTLALIRAAGPLGVVIAGLATIIALWNRMPSFSQFGAALEYRFLGIRSAALHSQADELNGQIQRDAQGNPLDTPQNRDLMQRRQRILDDRSELEARRQRLAEDATGETAVSQRPASSGPGHTGHWTPYRGGGASHGPARHPRGSPAVALDGNNPGGILDGPFARSQSGYVGNNGMYAAFRTMQEGERAQSRLLQSYVSRGFNTPWRIAHRWAPAGAHGNNPAAYAANIARSLGIGVHDRLTAAQLLNFQRAQSRAENIRYGGGGGARTAMRSGRGGASGVHVGSITVYVPPGTPRQQAERVADEIPRAVQRRGVVAQANSGLK